MGPLITALQHLGPDRVVGVVFDDDYLCGVELAASRLRGRRRRIERTASLQLEPGVVAHNEVADHDAFVAALRSLWELGGFRTQRAALGLNAGVVMLRQAELPVLSAEELSQAAAYEIGDLLRYPLEHALVSTVELGRSKVQGTEDDPEAAAATTEVLTLAVHEATVLKLATVTREAGLQPIATELELAALVGADPVRPRPGAVHAMVHVTEWVTEVIVHDSGGILFGRVIAAGIDVSEASLSDQLAMELALLEGFTSGQAGGPADSPGTQSVAGPGVETPPGIATVVEGVRRTLQYYLTEVDHRTLERVAVCGPQSGVAGLVHAFGECFPSAEVARWEALGEGYDAALGPAFDTAYAVAAAATGGGRGLRHFDLVPPAIRARRTSRRQMAIGVAVAAGLCPILGIDALSRHDERAATGEQLEAAGQVVASLQTELAGYDDDQARLAESERAAGRVNELASQDFGSASLVRQVAEAMPADTFLISLRVNRAGPGELPTGYNGPEPTATVSFSGVAGNLDGVGRWMQDVDEIPVVDGLWLTQTAFGPYDESERLAAVFTVDGAVTSPAAPFRTLDGGQ